VPIADLSLTKSVDDASPNVGENVVFTVVVTNDGPSDATGVTVSDILPSGYTYVSDDQGDDLADDTWDIASLANGVSATLNITAEVQASGDYTNYAQVATSDQDDPDSTPGDNLDTDDLDDGIVDDDEDSALVAPVPIADLSLTKSVDDASPNVGENVVFTVVVTNDGPSDATGVTVSDVLPSGYSYVSDDQGDDLADDTWDIGALAKDASATLNITATKTSDAKRGINNPRRP